MSTNFYEQGIEFANKATAADAAEDYHNAFDLYMKALDRLQAGMQYDKDPSGSRKKLIEDKALVYLSRAEEIKKHLDAKAGHTAGGGAAVAAKPPGGEGGGGGEDAEASKLKGSLSKAIVSEKPNVKWDDVAGLESAKSALKEAVILPVKFPQLFTGNRKPWKGILLYGPPGTGKSFLAKAVATEANATFFSVSSSDLVSKWLGECEKLVRNLFEMARENKPSIVFIDEIDSLVGARGEGGNDSRRGILTEFLVQMQGVGKNQDGVLVLAATNTPWDIDAGMRRRFEKRIYIPLPEREARARMFRLNIGDTPNNLTDGDYYELADFTEGFSGSDISTVVREALMEPLRKCQTAKFFFRDPRTGLFFPVMEDPPCARCPPNLTSAPAPRNVPCQNCGCVRMSLYDLESSQLQVPVICIDDFRHIMKRTKATVAKKELEKYDEWTKEFGQEGA